jgi:hypothetical protein
MPERHQWSRLNHLQVGRYAEYFVKMQFVLLGFDVYTAEVDDRGIDFVLRQEPDRYWDVQVKSIRKTGYVFFPKAKTRIRPTLLIALVIFRDGEEPDLFLVPAATWENPGDDLQGVLVIREYEGLKSPPEYGINLSRKGIKALNAFRFDSACVKFLGVDGQAEPPE